LKNIRFDVYEGFCNLKHVRFLAKFKLKLKNYLWVLCYLVMEFCYNIFAVLLVRVKTEVNRGWKIELHVYFFLLFVYKKIEED
jgi:hypothetical protein